MRILAHLLFLGATAIALADEFTPETAAVFALRHNQDLAAARHLIGEAEGRLTQAGLWSNPEIEMRSEIDLRSSRGDRLFDGGFRQRFPWSGRLKEARTLARTDVAMAVAELRNRERILAGDVLGKARALLILERRLRLNEENRELLERIFQQTSALTATGQATAAEARVVALDQTTLALTREALQIERQARLAELNGLLGRAPGLPLAIGGTLPEAPAAATMDRARAASVQRRPDRRLAALRIDEAQASQRLARAERWQDLGIGAGIMREREDGMHDTMASFIVSVPLPLWNRNQGRIAESVAAQARASQSLEALDLAIATEIREAEVRVTGLAGLLERTRGPAVDLARSNTQLIQQTYGDGTASFLTVFESRRQHLAIEQAAIETAAQLTGAITDWEARTGSFPALVRGALAQEPALHPIPPPRKAR